jgi:signal transduction histidine kinase
MVLPMTSVFFVYGLAFFSLGLVVAVEARRSSALALSRHLIWLAAFGLVHSLVEWADMFISIGLPASLETVLSYARIILLPLSAAFLIRFGAGLLDEAGPLPDWLTYVPPALVVVLALVASYGIVVALTEPPIAIAADVWSRYLLYLPGCLLAAAGFVRQAAHLPQAGLGNARPLLWGAAAAFGLNALVAGLLVPPAPYGLAPWLNSNLALAFTGLPVQVWRALSALGVTLFVFRAMGVFEVERKQTLARLADERERSQQATLFAQSEARHAAEGWTNSLVGISRSIANMEDVDQVLASIVETARQLLTADVAALALWDEAGQTLELKCFATAAGTTVAPEHRATIHDPRIAQVVRDGQSRRVPEQAPAAFQGWLCPALGRPLSVGCVVSLRLNSQSLGGMWVGREAAHPFTPGDLSGLERLADQAVIALEHALMAARLQSLAVTEERARIAREMHDGLAQVLGYLSLQTQTLEALVRRGDCGAALAELKLARARILEAQADVRENILSLRTTLAGDIGLLPALQQYLAEFEVQTGIGAELLNAAPGGPRLSPLAEAQLVRIVQEALTNVRKHAGAANVQVRLAAGEGVLRVTVSDNGRGITAPENGRWRFGLSTMRERAESVGGGLDIRSAPDAGTTVEAWLPLLTA